MPKPKVIGLTGSIGAGKSVVASMLASLGATVVSADQVAREVVAPGTPALAEIVATFGPEYLQPDGTLDRRKLGALVFADLGARRKLNAITHPRILARLEQIVSSFRRQSRGQARVLVLEIPLLVEAGASGHLVDEVWVVVAPTEVRLARIMARDGLTEAEAIKRLAAHLPQEEKVRYARRVIDNGGSLADTRAQVEALWQEILREEANDL